MQWLKRGRCKRQTESFLVTAQDQALETNYRTAKARLEKNRESTLCRMCKQNSEAVTHSAASLSKQCIRKDSIK